MYVVWNRKTGEYKRIPDVYKAQSLAQGLNSQGNGTWSIKKESEIKADPSHELYHSLHDDQTNLTPESREVGIQAQTPYLGEEATHLRTPDYLREPAFNPRPVQREMPASSSPGYDEDYQLGLQRTIRDRQDHLLANQGLPPQSEQLGVVPASPGRLAADYAAPFDQTQGLPTVVAPEVAAPSSSAVWQPDPENTFPETPNFRVKKKVRMRPPKDVARENIHKSLGNVVVDGQNEPVRISSGDGYLRSRTDEEIMMDEQDPFWWMR